MGDVQTDHDQWGRPEDIVDASARPAYAVSPQRPGSDVASATAAALAAASMVFSREGNSAYAATLLTHATQLYEFAKRCGTGLVRSEGCVLCAVCCKGQVHYPGRVLPPPHPVRICSPTTSASYPGLYSDVIPIDGSYPSTSYWDDLAWGAVWLFKATGTKDYLTQAQALWSTHLVPAGPFPLAFDWNAKTPGVAVLLAEQVQPWADAAPYRAAVDSILRGWRPKGRVPCVAFACSDPHRHDAHLAPTSVWALLPRACLPVV